MDGTTYFHAKFQVNILENKKVIKLLEAIGLFFYFFYVDDMTLVSQ